MADNDLHVVTYEADFNVPAGFGPVGAVLVANEHGTEMFLEDVKVVTAGGNSDVIRCDSWLPPKSGDAKRVFFANKVRNQVKSVALPSIGKVPSANVRTRSP